MARLIELCSSLLLALLLVKFSIVTSSFPPYSPSPSPSPQPHSASPISPPPSQSPSSTNSPHPSSPPVPLASPSSPSQKKAPSSPTPSSSNVSDINGKVGGSSGEMSTGKKTGIVVGVIVGIGVVGIAGFVYKKRQDNIRRSQYRYAPWRIPTGIKNI